MQMELVLDDCVVCKACETKSNWPRVVVARGNPLARLMVIGEAPGAKEDELGIPFAGRSGSILNRLMEEIGFDVNRDVYICNAVKCRPPKNRRPTKLELKLSRPWLMYQIKLVDPFIIALLGSTAVESVLGIRDGITKIRGNWHKWNGRLIMPLFHPAYLLRNPSKSNKGPIALTKSDLQEIRYKLGLFKHHTPMSVLEVDKSPSKQ